MHSNSKPFALLLLWLFPLFVHGQSTFLKTYGGSGNEGGQVLVKLPDGNLMIGGYKQDSSLLLKVDPDGNVLQQTCFRALTTSSESIVHMVVDRGQSLVGVGVGGPSGNGSRAYAFRYNLNTNTFVWLQRNQVPGTFHHITQVLGTGDYLISGATWANNPPGHGWDGHLMRVNRNTGQVSAFNRNYNLGSAENINHSLVINDTIYSTGRYNKFGGGFAGMRFSLSKFDLMGNEISTRLLLKPTSNSARMYYGGMLQDGDSLLLMSQGNFNGTSSTYNSHLTKVSKNGGINWAKEYRFTGFSTAALRYITRFQGGYLATGHTTSPSSDLLLVHFDLVGNVNWARRIGGTGTERVGRTKMLLVDGPYIYLTAQTNSTGAGGNDIVLIKAMLNGTIGGGCPFENSQAVTIREYPTVYNGPESLTGFPENSLQQSITPPLRFSSPTEMTPCSTVVLPIQFKFTSAHATWSPTAPRQIDFQWTVAQPEQVAHFELQQVGSGFPNSKLSQVQTIGAGQYSASSFAPQTDGRLQYRLVAIDWDGQAHYSETLSLISQEEASFAIRGVQIAENDQLLVHFETSQAASLQASLLNPLGQTLWQAQWDAPIGASQRHTACQLPAGIYYFRLTDLQTGTVLTRPFVK